MYSHLEHFWHGCNHLITTERESAHKITKPEFKSRFPSSSEVLYSSEKKPFSMP